MPCSLSLRSFITVFSFIIATTSIIIATIVFCTANEPMLQHVTGYPPTLLFDLSLTALGLFT
jgi:hypothetical protein